MLPLVFLAPLVVGNASLSLPIPKGYTDVSAEAVKKMPALANKGAIALVKGGVVSINLVPAEHMPDADFTDTKECAVLAKDMEARLHGESPSSTIVAGPTGKTCQIALSYRKPPILVLSTIVRGPKDSWMLTCTMGPMDAEARQGCQAILRSIKFK